MKAGKNVISDLMNPGGDPSGFSFGFPLGPGEVVGCLASVNGTGLRKGVFPDRGRIRS